MSRPDASSRERVIGVEEHVWTPELRDALLTLGGDDTVRMLSAQPDTDRRLRDVGDERLARMDAAGVDLQVLSITTPGTQSPPPAQAVPLARDANDFLGDAVRRRPSRFAAFATLPTADPDAAANELQRCVTQLHLVGAMLFPRTGDSYLDHDRFRPLFEAADLGSDRVMFGADDPYTAAGFTAPVDVQHFLRTAPISTPGQAKLAYLNAERILALTPV